MAPLVPVTSTVQSRQFSGGFLMMCVTRTSVRPVWAGTQLVLRVNTSFFSDNPCVLRPTRAGCTTSHPRGQAELTKASHLDIHNDNDNDDNKNDDTDHDDDHLKKSKRRLQNKSTQFSLWAWADVRHGR